MHILLFLLIDIIIDSRVVLLNGDTTMASLFTAQPLPHAMSKYSPGLSNAPLQQRAAQETKKYAKANSFTLAIFLRNDIISQDFMSHCIKESATISYDVITIRPGINTLEDVFFLQSH